MDCFDFSNYGTAVFVSGLLLMVVSACLLMGGYAVCLYMGREVNIEESCVVCGQPGLERAAIRGRLKKGCGAWVLATLLGLAAVGCEIYRLSP